MWIGIAGAIVNDGKEYAVAFSIHDSVYNTDYSSWTVPFGDDIEKNADAIENVVLNSIRKFSQEHLCKFLGGGVALTILKEVRHRCLRSSYLHTHAG